jgi:hypothetical protein
MLKIPLPLFYVSADKNDQLTIVDGLQRISAINKYVSKESFSLRELEFLTELNGKKFSELSDSMQIRIEETNLECVVINPDSPPALQRNIFKRLNTGGLPLTDQEIRHALYYGSATDLLKELVETDEFKAATDESVNDSRMAAQELVLRFLAFSIMGVDEYRKDEEMDSFLSDVMQILNEQKERLKQGKSGVASFNDRKILNVAESDLRCRFTLAMVRAHALFENCAFRMSTPIREKRTPINKSLFEFWSVLLSQMPEQKFNALLDNRALLYNKLESAFANKESRLRDFIGKDSSKVSAVKGRYEIIGKMIQEVIEEGRQ